MKVILYMAITVNGMIATKDGQTSFVSNGEWDSFRKTAQEIGCVIYGHKSYDSIPIKGIPNIVLTHKTDIKSDKKEFVFMSGTPQEVLKKLATKGHKSVVVAGGGQTNAEFLKENLIDEIYLDIEPAIISGGIPLFRPLFEKEVKLKFLGVRKLSSQTVQLHYKVIK